MVTLKHLANAAEDLVSLKVLLSGLKHGKLNIEDVQLAIDIANRLETNVYSVMDEVRKMESEINRLRSAKNSAMTSKEKQLRRQVILAKNGAMKDEW